MNITRVQFWYGLLLMLLVLYPTGNLHAEVKPPKNPNSAKACALCHYRWIDTFFIEGRGSEFVDYTSEKVVATAEMCFSCHDGSIADSRARAYQTSQHKTNMPPPAGMKIPEIFPLDEKGNMQCATCHTAHGVPSGPDSRDTIFMRTSNSNSAMCRMCHADMAGGIKTGNHPVGSSELEIPRSLISMGATLGDNKNQMVCETCHTAHGSPYERYLIKSGRDSGLCLVCHSDKDIQTSDGRKRLVHAVNMVPRKVKIPETLIDSGARFGFNGEIICQSCHKVHNSKIEQKLLLIKRDKKSTLCLNCHADKHYIADTKHNLFLSAPEEKNLEGNTVAQAGVCSACHLPHKAARKIEADSPLAEGLCLSCHSKGNAAEKVVLTGAQHPLDVDLLNLAARGEKARPKSALPLFNDFGFQDKNGKLTCTTCHDPHQWRTDSSQAAAAKNSKGDRKTSFLRKPAPEICRECHSNKFYIANSKHDLDKMAHNEKNILNQTPAESGLCGSCHLVHNAQKGFLWARKRAADSDTVVQDLCTNCHNDQGIAKKKIIRYNNHPVNISPSEGGVITSLPLFTKTGDIAGNGMLACPTCHDPHRWDPLKTSDETSFKMEGTSQNSFLRLENSPAPKLCQNCHPHQSMIEKTDHDLRITAPSAKNINDETPVESGTCGVCHLVHNGPNKMLLWSQGFGAGNNIMEMICNSCHAEGGSAKNKIPQVYLHPREKLVRIKGENKKDDANYFPLFHGRSGKRMSVGNISCPSCHNVHQWDPKIPAKGSGMNAEGTATNSFLRSGASFAVCKECHGSDASLRIKYYHDADKRKFRGIGDMFF